MSNADEIECLKGDVDGLQAQIDNLDRRVMLLERLVQMMMNDALESAEIKEDVLGGARIWINAKFDTAEYRDLATKYLAILEGLAASDD